MVQKASCHARVPHLSLDLNHRQTPLALLYSFIFYIENLRHAEVTLPFLIESTSTVVENMLLANVLGCTWVSFGLE